MASLAGPVVICAVLFIKKFFQKRHKKLYWLRDSKLLLPRQRENYFKELLKEKNLKYAVSFSYPKTIDKLNIYWAARFAMRCAINKVIGYKLYVISKNSKPKIYNLKHKTIILVDGKNEIKDLGMEQMPIVKGDRKVFSIACASLIAKVFRDKMMIRYAKKFPGYGFEKHKGYPTKYHQLCLARLGPSIIHRKSFVPVAKLL